MKKTKIILLIILACFAVAQFFRPDFDQLTDKSKPADAKLLAGIPDSIESIFRSSCYDCHSDQTRFSWFDKITPANFLVASHIKEGRKAFNFSTFDSLGISQQNAVLYNAVNEALADAMPLPSYTLVHPDSKLTPEQFRMLEAFLVTRTPRVQADSAQLAATLKGYSDQLTYSGTKTDVAPELNGVPYTPGYRNWRAMSTADRFDNGSMRIIYANDVAVEAIRSGHTNPWPDGTAFAKTAWQQQLEEDGTVHTGTFIQVEFMIKDAKKYAATKGWGWGRWRGNELKPYGNNKHFDQECITCHMPVKDNDFVFTTPLDLGVILSSK